MSEKVSTEIDSQDRVKLDHSDRHGIHRPTSLSSYPILSPSDILLHANNPNRPVQARVRPDRNQSTIAIIHLLWPRVRVLCLPLPIAIQPGIVRVARHLDSLIRRTTPHLASLDPRSLDSLADELGAAPARADRNAEDAHDSLVALIGPLVLDGGEERRHAAFAQRGAEGWVERLVGRAGDDPGCDAADFVGVEGCVFGC